MFSSNCLNGLTLFLFVSTVEYGDLMSTPTNTDCFVDQTNETLTLCEYSTWLPWNCSCLNSIWRGPNMSAVRYRGQCCPKPNARNMTACAIKCNTSVSDGHEESVCEKQCQNGTSIGSSSSGIGTSTGVLMFPSCINILSQKTMTTVSGSSMSVPGESSTTLTKHPSKSSSKTNKPVGNECLHGNGVDQSNWCSFGSWEVIITDPISNVSVCAVLRLLVALLVLVMLYGSLLTAFVVYMYKKGKFPSLVAVKASVVAGASSTKQFIADKWSALRNRCSRAKTLPDDSA